MIVLLKWSERRDASPDDVTVHSIHHDRASLNRRLERIKKANKQYPMRAVGADMWKIGPDEDEGFFGNRPVWLRAVEKDPDPQPESTP